MPFTPFHLGPALMGLPFKRVIHLPTFITANLIVDVEPFLVLVFGLRYPLHGYLHTYIGALTLGFTLSCAMYFLDRYLGGLFKFLALTVRGNHSFKEFLTAGLSGTVMHVTLDSPLYTDIKPFYPLSTNPIHNPALSTLIYRFCSITMIIGVLLYLITLFKPTILR